MLKIIILFYLNICVSHGYNINFLAGSAVNLESGHSVVDSELATDDPYWPCPNPVEISPCVCTADADFQLDMDCSAVTSDEELTQSFQAEMSFDLYRTLTISPTDTSFLNTFTAETFGNRYFENVKITNTKLQVIDDGTFALSEDHLISMDLSYNQIRNYPFESLEEYGFLESLNLQGNQMTFEENLKIASNSLKSLDMSHNGDLYIGDALFLSCPNLVFVDLSYCSLAQLGTNLFGNLQSIESIDLSYNSLTALAASAISPIGNTITSLNLKNNNISSLNPGSITGALIVNFLEVSHIILSLQQLAYHYAIHETHVIIIVQQSR